MMKYRNREYNEKRNEVLKSAGLAALAFGAAAAGHILVSTNSVLVAVVCIVSVLGALAVSSIRSLLS